jgi:hypothetical protein
MNQHNKVHPIIAVEEHFVTERYWQEVSHSRMADVKTHLAEMDQAGIDVSVLSINRRSRIRKLRDELHADG